MLFRSVVHLKVPDLNAKLARQAVEFVHQLRKNDLRKAPSISETLDWAKALVALNSQSLDTKILNETLSILLKHETDLQKTKRQILSNSNKQNQDEMRRLSGN